MSENGAFQNEWTKKIRDVDQIIARFLPSEIGRAETLPEEDDVTMRLTVAEAMNYAVNAGGKRLRPLLMQQSFELFNGENRELLFPFMAAIEMIHTYSLVHDDLPAMDDDDYRRGKKTTHVVYGEAMGVLAGDALLNDAYETALIASEHCRSHEELVRVVLALRILARKAGIQGMVGGQCVDIESEKDKATHNAQTLYFIQENKTAALMEAALMCGAILANARVEAVDMMERAGSALGRSFQIRDDILDVTGNAETLGKTAGKDAKSQKLTYTSLYGAEKATRDMEALTEDALRCLEAVGAREDDFLTRLIKELLKREF